MADRVYLGANVNVQHDAPRLSFMFAIKTTHVIARARKDLADEFADQFFIRLLIDFLFSLKKKYKDMSSKLWYLLHIYECTHYTYSFLVVIVM